MANWTIQRLDTSEVHTFSRKPIALPNVSPDIPFTQHRLLDGSVKFDKVADSLLKTMSFFWTWVSRADRVKLETWAQLTCQVIIVWYDEDSVQHTDTGHLLLRPTLGTLFRKYSFGLTLVVTNEA